MNQGQERRSDLRLGGQAVIEGVMIKGPRHASVAVRTGSGEMKITSRDVAPRKGPPFSWPVIRGLVVFWQTLAVGMWALDVSAREAAGGEEEKGLSGWAMGVTFAVAFLVGAGLFFWLPLALTQALKRWILPLLASGVAFNLADGIIRMGIFVLYVVAIGRMPDIRRVFQYHGAEHKVVSAFEHEGRLAPESFPRYSTLHPRCGTAFLLTVMVVSILFFSLIPSGWPFWSKLAWRLVLLPAIAGVSFEAIRFADRPAGRRFAWMMAPGLWLQKLTTGEPDASQLEVAAAALSEVLRLEEVPHD